jgi:hypothetical protein
MLHVAQWVLRSRIEMTGAGDACAAARPAGVDPEDPGFGAKGFAGRVIARTGW